MYPFEYPHNRYQSNPHNRSRGECQYNNPRNPSIMPKRNEDGQHPSSHFEYQPYPSNYNHPPYYHYGAPPHLSYVQPPPPPPVPPCYCAHYCPPYPAYFVPPLPPSPCNYSMDCHHRPCYVDYYNHNSKTHCCGCTNHTCQPGYDASSSLRIQEEPFHQSETRESDDVVPPSNYAPPIVWRLPSSDSIKTNDDGSKYEEKASEKGEVAKMGPQSPSHPVIWLPRNSGFEEQTGDKNATASKSAQEWPSNLKFGPLNFLENGGHDEPENEVEKVAPPVGKKSNTKTIPVKQVDDRSSFVTDKGEGNIGKMVEEIGRTQPSNVKIVPLKFSGSGENTQQKTHDPVEKEIKTKTIPVKHINEQSPEKSCDMSFDKDKRENNLDGKEESTMNDTSEKKKPSTTKSSKLPPICLRVGPRPKKTSANSSGTSKPTATSTTRSKTNRERNEESSGEKMIPANTVNECNQNENVIPINIAKDNNFGLGKKEQVCEENVTIDPPEKNTSNGDSSNTSEVISKRSIIENHEKTGMEDPAKTSELKMNVDEEKVVEPIEKINVKKLLSETDAATIIQSAYRGFEVRRWHPLDKLKKIAEIREETNKIRRQVDDIEACPLSQLDARKKVVLGETIMNLLLQLDTIQGLHPSVKEVRKSLANELTCLEDKLDSIYSRITKEHDSSKLDENQADSLKCESNFVSPAPESMDDKITTSNTISLDSSFSGDDEAADVTSSTPVREVAREHDVIQEEKSPSYEESSKCESNFVCSAPETLKSGSCEPHPVDDKIAPSDAEQQMKSDVDLDFSPAGDDGAAGVTSTTPVGEAACDNDTQVDNDNGVKERGVIQEAKSPSYKERVDEEEIGEDVTQPSFEPVSVSDDDAVCEAARERVDDMKEHGIIEEVKLSSNRERVEGGEMNEEVKQQCFEGDTKGIERDAEEDTNASHVLVHQAEDERLEEEEDDSVEKKETGSIVERPTDDSEPSNIAADALSSVYNSSADALEEHAANSIASDGHPNAEAQLLLNCTSVESMDGEQESSTAVKSDGDSMVTGDGVEVSGEADIESGRKVDDDHVEGDGKDIGGDVMKEKEMRLFEENEKLRKMIEELVQSGNKQLNVITNLNGRVKDLEKKLQLTKKKKMKVRRSKAVKDHTGEVGGN